MKRWIAGLLALMLLLPSAALAVSYPAQRGAVNDDAGVLSEQTAADIGQLNTAARSADISFVVATRHFLGGADAQAYCDGLFEAWKLDRKTVLVLLVIGEERYAVAVGQGVRDMIGQEQINSLLRGEEGTTVTLTVLNPSGEEQTIEVQRRTYDMPTITYTVPEGTGYIQIYQFNSNTASEVQTAIETMQASTQLQALVFDMRNTSGGELDDVMDVIDLLCPVGPIASQQNKDGTVTVPEALRPYMGTDIIK